MELFLTLFAISKYFIIGFALLRLAQARKLLPNTYSTTAILLCSFLLGIGTTSLVLHIGILINLFAFARYIVWSLFILGCIYISILERTYIRSLFTTNLTVKVFAILAYLGNVIILSLQPVMAHDARAIWLIKAKAIYLGGTYFAEYLKNPSFWYSHTDYPITMPLLYADVLRSLPNYWEPAIGIVSFTFFFLLILGIYGAIRKYTTSKSLLAMLLAAALFFTPEYLRQGWAGLSDVPLSLAFFGVFLALLEGGLQANNIALPLIFAALGATIKNEGQTFLLLTLLVLAITYYFAQRAAKKTLISKDLIFPAATFISAMLPLVLWKYNLWTLAIKNDVASALNFSTILTRIPTLLNEVLPRLFDGYRFGILFTPAMLLLALPNSSKKRNPIIYILVGQALVYVVVYLTTPHDIVWHISTSFSRLLLHLLPSIYLLVLAHRSGKVAYNQL